MTDPLMRCPWCGDDPLYVAYHDHEWGVPERNPRALWEMLMLEAFQAGLSWITILRKREGFRRAFAGFDPVVVAGWDEADALRCLADPAIVRHRGKIQATIRGAQAYLRIETEEGFSPFLWGFVGGRPLAPQVRAMSDVASATAASTAMSKALKARGFGFCGPTISYAFMQAAGMVNDHLVTCPSHARVAALGG